MNKPLISIITPTFNNETTLHETIQSVMIQSYPHIEYVIVDDGSNYFDSNQIVDLVKKQRPDILLRIITNEYNIGTVKSLNAAIQQSTGKYIFNIAADDCFSDSEVISDWVTEFEKNSYMIITGLRDVYDHEMKVRLRTDPPKKVRNLIMKEDPSLLFHAMVGYNLIIGCCTAYSRKCIDQFGLFDERYRFIEDYPRYLFLSRMGVQIHLFDRIVIKYRQGGISSSENIDECYEMESDSIFENEILPFVYDKESAISQYDSWKRRNRIKKQFIATYYASHRYFKKMSLLLKFGFRDPRMVGLFLSERIKEKIHH